jgi:hypothetical protein
MLCATAVLWNQARIVACLAAFAVILGAFHEVSGLVTYDSVTRFTMIDARREPNETKTFGCES